MLLSDMPIKHEPLRDALPRTDTDRIVGGSRLLGEMRERIRLKHYSIRTEQAYLGWAKRYILFHGKRHPHEMVEAEIVAFLNHLAAAHPDEQGERAAPKGSRGWIG